MCVGPRGMICRQGGGATCSKIANVSHRLTVYALNYGSEKILLTVSHSKLPCAVSEMPPAKSFGSLVPPLMQIVAQNLTFFRNKLLMILATPPQSLPSDSSRRCL